MNKKTIAGVGGLLLIVGTIFGGGWNYLADWSSAEMVGYNIWTLGALIGGAYLIYWSFKK